MAPTQDALYAEIDLELSWSERDLPERERTKHVHRLHPYLGKFIPQLVETLLDRYLTRGGHVLDPFAGSGTTLVQALESGFDATGADIAAFNCLLMRVKTQRYNLFVLERELRDTVARLDSLKTKQRPSRYMREWFAPQAARELLSFRELVADYEHHDVLRVVLARAARSARRTTHFDLDFPRAPQLEPYWCHKHKRQCRPVERAEHFIRRYNAEMSKHIEGLTPEAMTVLRDYPWPGNVRELQNIVERLVGLVDTPVIGVSDLPLDLLLPDSTMRLRQAETLPLRQATDEFERQIVLRVLERVRWNRSEAARILGIHRNSLKTMLTRWDLGGRADDD